jgi:hypothetical protein
MDAQTRPQLLAKPRRRGFAQAPTAIIFFVIRRSERKDRREKSRFLRFYVASDIVSAFFYLRVAILMYMTEPQGSAPARFPAAVFAALAVAAFVTIIGGLLPDTFTAWTVPP